ncbi:MAG TPA: FAD:protein FMN transferase [Solirubrobacteraceae bacterium]|jgi:thiamine biosynthesis lipoprotein|nr:FAD:protein FMN transferase [Solirubrobacteraceae bacterium]
MTVTREASERFDCFGSACEAFVSGDASERSAAEAVELVRRRLQSWHEDFSRFVPDSELSRLNADPRWDVPVSLLMARLAQTVRVAATLTGGLVDATLVDQIQAAGYDADLGEPVPLADALAQAPPRAPASAGSAEGWQSIEVNLPRRVVTRPPGVKLDSGGLAKGLFADVLAAQLAEHDAFAVNCAGDLALGGTLEVARTVDVESPFDGQTLHTFELRRGGVATSGIGRRSWLDEQGRPAHHLLDPGTGRPAFTGIVQVTALAPSALMAEIHAKAAILSGPRRALAWLPGGGVIVFDDGSHQVIAPSREVASGELQAFSAR